MISQLQDMKRPYVTFFMACSKLEAMAIYVVNQACGNDIMPAVYIVYTEVHGNFFHAIYLTQLIVRLYPKIPKFTKIVSSYGCRQRIKAVESRTQLDC